MSTPSFLHEYEGTRPTLRVGLVETLAGEWSPCEACGRPIDEHAVPGTMDPPDVWLV